MEEEEKENQNSKKNETSLQNTETFFLGRTLIPDFVSIDPYCYDYASDNYDVKNGCMCRNVKDEPLRPVIKNAVKNAPICFAMPLHLFAVTT